MYAEPKLWVEKPEIESFQKLISSCFEKRAYSLRNLSSLEKQHLIEDQQRQTKSEKKKRKRLKRLKTCQIKSGSLTLNEKQREQEPNIEIWIGDLGFNRFRNKELPLHDDYALLVRFLKRQPVNFTLCKGYFGDNKNLSLLALSRWCCIVGNLDPSIATDQEILHASKTKAGETISFCNRYYRSSLT